ncbi:hypothetical protein HDU97_004176 [Phlyctochytrium planicorne]|nr:hypothetical protein HDU97_004176 [Phlyctochytrium planicorne]
MAMTPDNPSYPGSRRFTIDLGTALRKVQSQTQSHWQKRQRPTSMDINHSNQDDNPSPSHSHQPQPRRFSIPFFTPKKWRWPSTATARRPTPPTNSTTTPIPTRQGSRKASWVGSDSNASLTTVPGWIGEVNSAGIPILEVLPRDAESWDRYSDVGSPNGSEGGGELGVILEEGWEPWHVGGRVDDVEEDEDEKDPNACNVLPSIKVSMATQGYVVEKKLDVDEEDFDETAPLPALPSMVPFSSRFPSQAQDSVCLDMEMGLEDEEDDPACLDYMGPTNIPASPILMEEDEDEERGQPPQAFPWFNWFSSNKKPDEPLKDSKPLEAGETETDPPQDPQPPDSTPYLQSLEEEDPAPRPPPPLPPKQSHDSLTPPPLPTSQTPLTSPSLPLQTPSSTPPKPVSEDYTDPTSKKKRRPHSGVVLPTFDFERKAGHGASVAQVDVMPRTRRVAEKLMLGIQRMLMGGNGGAARVNEDGFREVKKVVILGIHGWFPQRWLQSVTGPPQGTSPRFIHYATRAVKKFFKDRYDHDLDDSNITSIPLEKEGMIEERAQSHFKTIVEKGRTEVENGVWVGEGQGEWVGKLREADLVLVVSHSQGVPVGVLLMDLLCQAGVVDPGVSRVCLLAMAGIWHGPFPSLQTVVRYVDTPAGNELFDLCSTDTKLSRTMVEALARNLARGIRVVAVSSWFDEVVPFYSSTAMVLDHPLMLRAMYIDENFSPATWAIGGEKVGGVSMNSTVSSTTGAAVAAEARDANQDGQTDGTVTPTPVSKGGAPVPGATGMGTAGGATAGAVRPSADDVDFLTHLIVFSLKLRNRGYSDHGLSLHLSKLIAGTFLGTRGHSALYDEVECYMLALSFAMGSKDIPPQSAQPLRVRPFTSPTRSNPYGLTFSMARIVSSPAILADQELKAEVSDLLERYDRWQPVPPELRTAKFALDGLKIASLRENLAMAEGGGGGGSNNSLNLVNGWRRSSQG